MVMHKLSLLEATIQASFTKYCSIIVFGFFETKGPFGYRWKLKTETENWKTL